MLRSLSLPAFTVTAFSRGGSNISFSGLRDVQRPCHSPVIRMGKTSGSRQRYSQTLRNSKHRGEGFTAIANPATLFSQRRLLIRIRFAFLPKPLTAGVKPASQCPSHGIPSIVSFSCVSQSSHKSGGCSSSSRRRMKPCFASVISLWLFFRNQFLRCGRDGQSAHKNSPMRWRILHGMLIHARRSL